MTKLNQIIAVEKGVKAQANDAITKVYHTVQKPDLFAGISRTYRPVDDEGEQLPPESTKVQVQAEALLEAVASDWTRLLDVTATKDWSNTQARADVRVGGTTIAVDVPVSYLIWLEKQLGGMRTLISKLPVLDPAVDWSQSDVSATWSTPVTETHRSKKVLRNHVKAEATPEHPAQVDVYTEDVVVGYWSTLKFSGALPQARVNELLTRVETLQTAVKMAREQANELDVVDQSVGGALFSYLLA